MRRSLAYMLLCAAALSVLAACDSNELTEEIPEETLSIAKSSLVIPAKGGEATIEVVSDGAFSAESSKAWCSIATEGSTVKVTAGANNSLQTRYSLITVRNGDTERNLTVQQFGFRTSTFSADDIVCPSDGEGYDIPYEYEDMMKAVADQDWVSVSVTENNLHIDVAKNTVQGSPSARTRSARVDWTLGMESGTITITQRNLSFMKEEAAWTLTYDGVVKNGDSKVISLTNTVTDPSTGNYVISFVPKADITKSGKTVAAYIEDILVPALQADPATAASLKTGTSTVTFSLPVDGTYCAFATGLDGSMEVTGRYATVEFEVEAVSAAYKKWLGEWTISRGSVTDTWTITQKEAEETYNIEGFENDPAKVGAIEAKFQDGNMLIYAQPNVGTVVSKTYGECTMRVVARVNVDGKATTVAPSASNPYLICTGTLNADGTATLTPSTVKLSSGGTYTIAFMLFSAKQNSGSTTLTYSKEFTQLPNSLTRIQ